MKMMKKTYIVPTTEVVAFPAMQLLNTTSLEVKDDKDDPVVNDPDKVYSRENNWDAWEEEEDDDDGKW